MIHHISVILSTRVKVEVKVQVKPHPSSSKRTTGGTPSRTVPKRPAVPLIERTTALKRRDEGCGNLTDLSYVACEQRKTVTIAADKAVEHRR